MLLTTKCTCGKLLDVDDEQFGQQAECPWCGNRFTAGAPVNSTTAVQAEEPLPEPNPAEREAEKPKPVETPRIDIGHPWVVPPAVWILIFGILGGGVLLVGLCYFGMGALGDSGIDIAAAQIHGPLAQACEAYRAKLGEYPQKLEKLLEQNAKGGPFLETPDALIDPWGNPYQYDSQGPRNNGLKPDIWTVSPNGVEIGNWPRDR